MNGRLVRTLLTSVLVALPTPLCAQPAQQVPPEVTPPKAAKTPRAQKPPQPDVHLPAGPGQAARSSAKRTQPVAARSVDCSGPFDKDSSHLKLATAFGSENIEFSEVEG